MIDWLLERTWSNQTNSQSRWMCLEWKLYCCISSVVEINEGPGWSSYTNSVWADDRGFWSFLNRLSPSDPTMIESLWGDFLKKRKIEFYKYCLALALILFLIFVFRICSDLFILHREMSFDLVIDRLFDYLLPCAVLLGFGFYYRKHEEK